MAVRYAIEGGDRKVTEALKKKAVPGIYLPWHRFETVTEPTQNLPN